MEPIRRQHTPFTFHHPILQVTQQSGQVIMQNVVRSFVIHATPALPVTSASIFTISTLISSTLFFLTNPLFKDNIGKR